MKNMRKWKRLTKSKGDDGGSFASFGSVTPTHRAFTSSDDTHSDGVATALDQMTSFFHRDDSILALKEDVVKENRSCDSTLSCTSTFSGSKSRTTNSSISPKRNNNNNNRQYSDDGVHSPKPDPSGWVHNNITTNSVQRPHSSNTSNTSQMRSPQPRVLMRHKPAPEWPPSNPSSARSLSPKRTKSGSTVSSSQSKGSTMRSPKRSPELRQQLRVVTDENAFPNSQLDIAHSNSSSTDEGSMPPPNFVLPRREVVEAITYHRKLGKALSKLALNNDVNDPSLTCSSVTGMSTLESLSEDSFVDRKGGGGMDHLGRLGATSNRNRNEDDNRGGQNNSSTTTTQHHVTFSHPLTLPSPIHAIVQSFSNDSRSTISGSSNGSGDSKSSAFEQHVAFLGGLEDHIQKFSFGVKGASDEMDMQLEISDSEMMISNEAYDTFFPTSEDLRSPPSCVSSFTFDHDTRDVDTTIPPLLFDPMASKVLTSTCLQSPPNTPVATLAPSNYKQSNNFTRCSFDGGEILVSMERIKNETAVKMKELQDKMKSELKEAIAKETDKIKLAMTESSKREEKESERASPTPSTQQQAKSTSSVSHIRSQFSSPWKPSTPQPSVKEETTECGAILKELQASLRTMESSIIEKIASRMSMDATQHHEVLDDIIEEKVTRVMAGANLEMQLAIQEVKKEMERATKIALQTQQAMRTTSTVSCSNVNAYANPVRYPLPNQCSPARHSTPNSNSSCILLDSPFSTSSSHGGGEEGDLRSKKKTLENSFADTMRVIDDFVMDCDDIANDFDKLAFRMEDSDVDVLEI